MSRHLGKQALVVGAGIGGLTAARVLADHFDHVIILERDTLPSQADTRAGIPQGKHVHVLLAGGLRTLCELFPDFDRDLDRTGAVRLQTGLDIRTERPGYDPYPQRDLGIFSYAQSRAQLELHVRQRVVAHANITLLQQCRVQALTACADGSAVTGLTYIQADGTEEACEADFIVDASGRGILTLELLTSLGHALPETTVIGVDITYATAVFAIPADAPRDWQAVYTLPQAPESSKGALLMPIEGKRWVLSLGGRPGEEPPGDADGFMEYVRQLRTPTIYQAIKHARRLGEIARFRFPESIYRHYARLPTFPQGLVPLGDALCRFNPIYGQGMSVAIQEAQALGHLLAARATTSLPLAGLAQAFFAEADLLMETPWTMAAIPDFIYRDTRGKRPGNFRQQLRAGIALTELAARDPAVHKLVTEVGNLLKPHSAYQDPALVQRLQDILTER